MSQIERRRIQLSGKRRAMLDRLLESEGILHSSDERIPRRQDRGFAPLSFSQERLWLLDQLEPGNPAYNLAACVLLGGQLNQHALEHSLNEIVRRHEVLRTRFEIINGQPMQVIEGAPQIHLDFSDLSNLPPQEKANESRRLAIEHASQSFNLGTGPLVHGTLLRLNKEEHVLLVNMHHIVCDGWSIGVFIKELGVLYKALSEGDCSTLPEPVIQYADFATWQRKKPNSEDQISYWKKQLDAAPAALDLPTDWLRPPARTFRGAHQTVALSKRLTNGIKLLGQQSGCTPFMVLLAAFNALLFRHTGQDDILVGTPVAGRDQREIEGLIGFFLNTLVLRADLSGDPTFRQLLARVSETTLGAFNHQALPFERLLAELQRGRDLSTTPLFQVYFNMLNFPESQIELPGLKVDILPYAETDSKFDLTLYIKEQDEAFLFNLVYNDDLFSQDRMKMLLDQFNHLLSQVINDPDSKITAFSLVTPDTSATLPDPSHPLSSDWEGAIQTWFFRRAQRAPDRPAIIFKEEVWTYGELEAASNRLANYLVSSGVQVGDTVAIYGHRSPPLVQAVLGVLKAGGVFVILDPAYPAPRLIDCLRLAEPKGWIRIQAAGQAPEPLERFLTDSKIACRIQLPPGKEAAQDGPLSNQSPAPCGVEVGPDSVAYISLTSGSTGRPKGILGRHGPLSHFLPWQQKTFDLRDTDRYSMLSGLSHDPLHRDMFTPLAFGASIHIPDPALMERAGWLARWMMQEGVTVTHLTPALLQMLNQALSESDASPPEISSLRYAFTVGDALTGREVNRLRRMAPGVRFINYYGATETQRAVSYFEIPHEAAETSRQKSGKLLKDIVPLGRGIRDVQLLVINNAQQLAGVGELGEICFRSPHLARGYKDDELLTAERFIKNPFTGLPDDRLYKTGDLGRYLPDGNVEFAGRNDFQVKIRGYRVELGEVEAALNQHDKVRAAIAVVREDPRGDKRLVAYIVPATGQPFSFRDLRAYLQENLPEYMVPSAYVELAELPVTPNRKIDRQSLPSPDWGQLEAESDFVAPATLVQEVLAAIWAEVLGVEQVGACSNFFELGGHSLLATQVIARAQEAFKVDLALRSLFEAPTIAGLARVIEQRMSGPSRATAPLLVSVERTADSPLSFAQQRLWFLDQLHPGNSAYNIPAAARLSGRLNLASLEQALLEILARHEALRTVFVTVNKQPVQRVLKDVALTLFLADLRGLPEGEVVRLARQEARRPFRLDSGPLLRASLLRTGDDEHVLLFTMHHIISDAWSRGVIVREVSALYESFSSGSASPLPPLRIQYSDFARWQREWLQGEVFNQQLDYWKKQLDGATQVLQLPTDLPRPSAQTFRGAVETLTLDKGLTAELEALGRREGATLFMVIAAAFQTLLSYCTGKQDIVIGTDIANRKKTETEGLIGFFVNQLPLRGDLSGNPAFRQSLARLREVALGAYLNQDLPFEKLVEELKPERDLEFLPLFQVKLVYQNVPMPSAEFSSLSLEPLEFSDGQTKFDLTLFLYEPDGQIRISLEYKTDLFVPRTARRMLNNFNRILEIIAEQPDIRLEPLCLHLAETDRKEREQRALNKFKKVKPKLLKLPNQDLIEEDYLRAGQILPLVIRPAVDNLILADWARGNRDFVEGRLLKHGAMLFRGFNIVSVGEFERFALTICPDLFSENGELPRARINGNIYTPVEYPADKPILWHNENTFCPRWPGKIMFLCKRPALQGGETPIADSRDVLRLIAPEVKDRFIKNGVMYMRNYGDGLGLDWQVVFQTTSRSEVEDYCRKNSMQFQWKPGDRLRTRAVRPAVIRHPKTGEMVWFNQATHWHISCLNTALRASLLSAFSEEDLPRHCYYGDGSPIEDSVMEHVCEVYKKTEVCFPWQSGDIMLIDNMLAAHARNPYAGPRELAVAMGQMTTDADLKLGD
jgi:amino acid adenylation domain-containing protein